MKPKITRTASLFLASAQQRLTKESLPLIVKCLQQLSDDEIWWRPNPPSNSAGNLVLHLCGNMRQWIIAGLGGEEFQRQRDLEFSERGPIARKELVARLRRTVRDASRVLGKLSDEDLARKLTIQGYHVTGLDAVFHVTEHFGYHTGQIAYITKMTRAHDLRLTRLPVTKPAAKLQPQKTRRAGA